MDKKSIDTYVERVMNYIERLETLHDLENAAYIELFELPYEGIRINV